MRKVNTYVLLCAVGLLTLGSCDKPSIELPEPNEPVFVLNGTLSGVDFNLIAGDNNAFMHTSTKVVKGVNLFSGELTDGNFSVELGIFDGFIDKPGHITVEEIQNIVPTFAKRSVNPLVVLNKSYLGNSQNIQKVDWYINGSLAGSDELALTEPGKYKVCANITFNNGDYTQLCDDIIIGYKRSANCSIHFSAVQGQVLAEINSIGSTVTGVEWFVNDEFVSSALLFNTTSFEIFNLKARVTFDNGVVRTRTVHIDAANNVNSVNDFSVMEMASLYSGPNQDFNIHLRIKSDGKTYLSEYANNKNSTLIITGIEYYGVNADGNDVYKISGMVNAVVMELVTEKMVSVNFSTVFGFEIR